MSIREIVLHRVALPLHTPYRLSYRVVEVFEPILVEIRDADGRVGWGEAHISPGSSSETPAGGLAFCRAHAERLVGLSLSDARAAVRPTIAQSPVAATGMMTALEMLARDPVLETRAAARLPLLCPFNAMEQASVSDEVEERLARGFRTFKIKVGQDVVADLARVGWIQDATAGRATLRIDANRAYSQEDGCRFAEGLDPTGVELFEQPCAADDWDANAAVAAVSRVPLMLDEPICGLADIDRAATIPGVGLCKLKLKRFGGLGLLRAALDRVRDQGLEPVLGDGLGTELAGWMEGCVARETIRNAGEFNGFLKPSARLLVEPLVFVAGHLEIPAGYWPEMDRDALQRQCLGSDRFSAGSRGAAA